MELNSQTFMAWEHRSRNRCHGQISIFIRPYHVKEEDKALTDKEMKWLCYLGILKEGFSAYSSPVMLISRKLTKDKRVVTDFRHLNVRIAKNNLAYPLLKDTFSVLGSSRCEVLSVLDLKDAFHCLRYQKIPSNTVGYSLILVAHLTYIRECPGTSIWKSYIDTILNCLQSKENIVKQSWMIFYCLPIKNSHITKLEDLLKALLKNGLKISPKKCQLFRTNLHYMGIEIFIQNKRVCVKPLRSILEAIQKLQPPLQ